MRRKSIEFNLKENIGRTREKCVINDWPCSSAKSSD